MTSNLVGLGADLPAPLRKAAEATCRCASRRSLLPESSEAARRRATRCASSSATSCRRSSCATCRATRRACCAAASACSTPRRRRRAASQRTLNRRQRRTPMPGARSRASSARPRAPSGSVNATGGGATCRTASRCARRRSPPARGASPTSWPASRTAKASLARATSTPSSSTATSSTAAGARPAASRASCMRGWRACRCRRREAEGGRIAARRSAGELPALDIVVDDFELRGKRLGRVEIEAANRGSAEARDAPREWRLSRLNMSSPKRAGCHREWSAAAPSGGRRQRAAHASSDGLQARPGRQRRACSSASGWAGRSRAARAGLTGQVVVAGLAAVAGLHQP